MKRKHLPPLGGYGCRKRSQSDSKLRNVAFQSKDVPLRTVFARLLNDVTSQNIESVSHPRVTVRVSKPKNKRGGLYSMLCLCLYIGYFYHSTHILLFLL